MATKSAGCMLLFGHIHRINTCCVNVGAWQKDCREGEKAMCEVCPDKEEREEEIPVDLLVSDPPEAAGASEIPLFPDQNPYFWLRGSLLWATQGPAPG